jgi:F-type H+-transporting ATPase subunit b
MFRSWSAVWVVLLAVFLVAAAPTPARAAGAADEMFVPPRLDLMIWTIIVFGALLFVLGRFAWKPMLEGLKGRENRIRGALDEAQGARDDAQRLREQLQAEMAKMNDKMREMMDEARREGQAQRDRMIAEAQAAGQAERERARREIQMETEQAKQELRDQTAQLATLVSAKVIGRSLNAEDHRGLVDEALAELPGAAAQKTTA